jgi:HSP20 family molecular chaperone IbpA
MATKQASNFRPEHRGTPPCEKRSAGREQIPIRDLSDCLLAAYEGVSRRAFQLHKERGAEPGSELKDWKDAERDLLGAMAVDLEESQESIYALASVPGYVGKEISVAVEDRWLLISGYGHCFGATEPSASDVEAEQNGMASTRLEGAERGVLEWSASCLADSRCGPDAQEVFQDCVVRTPFCVVELEHRVDATRSVAVVANGLLAVRMAKVREAETVRKAAEDA